MIQKKTEQISTGPIYNLRNTNNSEAENQNLSEALRISEEKFQKVFENDSLGIAVTDEKGKFISVNRRWLEIFGYRHEDVLDENNFDLLFAEKKYYYDFVNKLKTGEVENFSIRDEFLTRDGEKIPCSLKISPLFENGNISFLQTVSVSEKMNSDSLFVKNQFKFLNTLINSIPNPVYYVNTHGIFLGCNRAFAEFSGSESENLFGRSIFDLAPLEIAQKERESDLQLINAHNSVCYEAQYPSKGKLIDVLISKSIFYNNDGTVAGILSVLIDISERVKAENALKLSEQKLKEVNIAKDKFFSIISHNLKNPFTALLGFSEMLIEDFEELSDEDKLSFLSEIKNSSRFAFSLLENLLQWSRLELGKLKSSPEFIQLKPIAEEIINDFSTKIADKNITLHKEISDSIIVRADLNMMKSIIMNLISNAVKFVGESGVIKISAKHNGSCVIFEVLDNGPGLSQKVLDNLFKIDSHQSSNGNSNEKGTGLGLIITKRFIEINNGTIKIENNPEAKGAKAEVRFAAG